MRNTAIESDSRDYLFIDSSINYHDTLASLPLAQKYPFIYLTIGFHPFCAKEFCKDVLAQYEKLARDNSKIIGIGEIGLDYKADISQREQEEILSSFLVLADQCHLPVLIHNRFPSPRILDILDGIFKSYENIVFHCFSYSRDLLNKILSKGGFVSFSLNILRKKDELLDSFASCPLENIFLETDSPYMKINGRISSPLDIREVYAFAAAFKGIEEKRLQEAILANAKKVFKLSGSSDYKT